MGQKAYVFGGELVPRQPVDNKVDVVDLGDEKRKMEGPRMKRQSS